MQKVILDFDGTLTDVGAESVPFIDCWLKLFSERSGISSGYVEKEIRKIKDQLASDAQSGWIVSGKVMAPACSDPYMMNTVAYQRLVQGISMVEGCVLPSEQEKLDKMFFEIFTESYRSATTVFRSGAKDFLDALLGRFDVTIVTNSKTEPVQKKLATIGDHSTRILGDAKKYVPDSLMDGVPELITPEGFPRSVYLRRPHYKKILDGFNPQTTAVVGDIYELDLALPEHLGFAVVQIETLYTPAYEIAHHSGKPRNCFARSYDEVLDFLESLSCTASP